jgi:hypothetical protein
MKIAAVIPELFIPGFFATRQLLANQKILIAKNTSEVYEKSIALFK